MVNADIRDDFRKTVYRFFRDTEGIDKKDMAELLRHAFEFYADAEPRKPVTDIDLRSKLSPESVDAFRALWENFVQETIDYIRNHDDVRNLISEQRDRLTKEWNSETTGHVFVPDTALYFSADGLDKSVEEGKWTSATDSSLRLCIGRTDILFMM